MRDYTNEDIVAGKPVSIHMYYRMLKGMTTGVRKQADGAVGNSSNAWKGFAENLEFTLRALEQARAWPGIEPEPTLRDRLTKLIETPLTEQELRSRVEEVLDR